MQNFLTGAGALTIDGKLIDGYGGGAVAYIDCHDIAACAAALLAGPVRSSESFGARGRRVAVEVVALTCKVD